MPAEERACPARIPFLDEVRGLCCVLMVFHHAFYTLGYFYGIRWGQFLFDFFAVPGPFFAGLFILISGICCRFSRNNWKRGGLLLGVSLAMTLVLWLFMRDSVIWYGVLHFLATAILLYALLHRLLDRIPPAVGVPVFAVLTLLFWCVSPSKGGFIGIPGLFTLDIPAAWQSCRWLFPLGLANGQSADYFPFLQWIWVFLMGVCLGRWAAEGRFPAFMSRPHAPWLSAIGRYTLWIYLAHQPVIYGICWLLHTIGLIPAAG